MSDEQERGAQPRAGRPREFFIDLESINFPDHPSGQTKWDAWDSDMGNCFRVIEYSAYELQAQIIGKLKEALHRCEQGEEINIYQVMTEVKRMQND